MGYVITASALIGAQFGFDIVSIMQLAMTAKGCVQTDV